MIKSFINYIWTFDRFIKTVISNEQARISNIGTRISNTGIRISNICTRI